MSNSDPSLAIAPNGEGESRGGTFRALRHRNYRLFFAGQTISLIGSWAQMTALIWLAYHLTGTSRWPALIAAAQLLPTVILGAWGGVLADRFSKHSLVFRTQLGHLLLALVLAGLVAGNWANHWHLLIVASLTGLVNAVDLPARLSFVVDLVGKEDLINAVALNSLMFNLARMVGPALGGWLLPRWGAESCFLINAFSYLAVLLALGAMTGVPESLPRVSQRGWKALMEGIRYVHHHPTLRPLMTLAGAMALFGWPVLALLPAFSAQVLGRGDQGYSLMLSSLGCGALTAALLVASLGSMQRRRGFLAFGVLTAATGLLGLSLAANLQAAMLCCGLAGLGLVAFFATSQGVVQLSAGDENRGRVMGIYSIVVSGLVPVGNLIAGPAADRWGEDFTIRLQALAILAAGALIAVWSFGPRRH